MHQHYKLAPNTWHTCALRVIAATTLYGVITQGNNAYAGDSVFHVQITEGGGDYRR